MALVFANTAEGTATGTTVTAANSATGGTAFTLVNITSGGTFTFDTTHAANGLSGFKSICPTTATNVANGSFSSTQTTLFGRLYLYIGTLQTGGNVAVMRAHTTTATRMTVGIDASGHVIITNASAATVGTSTTVLSTATLYRLEFTTTINSSTGSATVKIFVGHSTTATETLSVTSQAFGSTSASSWDFGTFAITTLTASPTFWIDSLNLNTTGYPGPEQFEASATGSVNGGDSFTITLSTTGTNQAVIVGIDDSNNVVTNVTPTSSNLSFSQVGSAISKSTSGVITLWAAIAATQLTSEVITCSATPTGNFPQLSGWAAAFSNVNTTTPVEANNNNSSGAGNGTSAAVTTTTANDLVIAMAGESSNLTMVPGTDAILVTQIKNAGNFSSAGLLKMDTYTPTPGSVTAAYTLGGSTTACAIIVAALKPPSAGGTVTVKQLSALGVG